MSGKKKIYEIINGNVRLNGVTYPIGSKVALSEDEAKSLLACNPPKCMIPMIAVVEEVKEDGLIGSAVETKKNSTVKSQ